MVNLGIAARRRFPVATLAVVASAYLPMLFGEVPGPAGVLAERVRIARELHVVVATTCR